MALKRVATEPGLLSRMVPIIAEDMSNYTPVTRAHVGGAMSVEALCQAAVQYSDNTAANLLMRLLGGPAGVTRFARTIGDDSFRLDRWEPALNAAVPGRSAGHDHAGSDARGSAADRCGQSAGPARARDAHGLDARQPDGVTRIRAAVPAEWVAGDKSGGGDYGTTNDAAVLWQPGQAPLVLVVYFTQRAKDATARDAVVADAARIALDRLKGR